MLIDYNVEGKQILIIGGGSVGEFKAKKALQTNSNLIVVSKDFTQNLKDFGQNGLIKLVQCDIKSDTASINSLIKNSDVIIIATEDEELNKNLAIESKAQHKLVSVVDNPAISDFNSPAIAKFGEIRIGICTGGKSPAMSRILRKRIESLITTEDILQVELQEYVRKFLKENSENASHKDSIYKIINNQEIKSLLKAGKLEESKELAQNILKNS